MINQYLDYIQEGYIFSDKTISIDLDKFESGESNKLIISGVSGAGKSTLGKYLAKKYNCGLNELDLCCRNSMSKEEYSEFFNGKSGTEFQNKMFLRFYEKCFKPSMLSNKREILEGSIFQAYALYPSTRSLVNKYPVIIIGKSAVKASWDRTERAIRNPKNKDSTINYKIKKHISGLILNLLHLQKQLEIYKKERIKVGGNIQDFQIPKLQGVIKL